MKRNLCLGYTESYVGAATFPFDSLFKDKKNVTREGWDGVDALILWGGEDIHPSFYGEKHHPMNQASVGISGRDSREKFAIEEAVKLGIPIIGVCRGAQFLCAVAGGTLVQHCMGHTMQHLITCKNGYEEEIQMMTSSAHHQMLNPWNLPEDHYEVLAWSSERRAHKYENGERQEIPEMKLNPEPEIVYFPYLKGLAIQGHPEWMPADSTFVKYCLHLINEFLLNPQPA